MGKYSAEVAKKAFEAMRKDTEEREKITQKAMEEWTKDKKPPSPTIEEVQAAMTGKAAAPEEEVTKTSEPKPAESKAGYTTRAMKPAPAPAPASETSGPAPTPVPPAA